MKDVKLKKLTELVQRRASEVILYELSDPRLGFVTVSRVRLSRDLRHAIIYYSVVGSESDRSKTAHALEHARGHIQSRIAHAMHTRVTPIIEFRYDEAVEGAVRVSRILDDLKKERKETDEGFPSAAEEE